MLRFHVLGVDAPHFPVNHAATWRPSRPPTSAPSPNSARSARRVDAYTRRVPWLSGWSRVARNAVTASLRFAISPARMACTLPIAAVLLSIAEKHAERPRPDRAFSLDVSRRIAESLRFSAVAPAP